MNKADKLVAMSNQIAGFFATQPGDRAGAIAAHLVKFWTVGMCATLVAHIQGGGDAQPLVKEAAERLHKSVRT
jgi:formate dehydrogenase subunit delta